MIRQFCFASLLAFSFIVGCGGPSDDDKLSELEDSDAQDLCADSTGGEAKECSDGTTVKPATAAECAASLKQIPDSCAATVGDFNDCADADPCDALKTEGCLNILKCYTAAQ